MIKLVAAKPEVFTQLSRQRLCCSTQLSKLSKQ